MNARRPNAPGYKASQEQLEWFAAIVAVIGKLIVDDAALIRLRETLEAGHSPAIAGSLFLDPTNAKSTEEKQKLSEAINAVALLLTRIYEESFNRAWARVGGVERVRLVSKAIKAKLKAPNLGLPKERLKTKRRDFDRVVDVPHSDEFIRRKAAALVVQIGRDQRQAVREVLQQRYDPKKRPDVLVRQIKQIVGLHSRYANAVLTREEQLRMSDIPEARVQQETLRYAKKLLQSRAQTIARTETVDIESQARSEAWASAADEGIIDADKNLQEWVTISGDTVCPVCDSLDNQTRKLGESFDSIDGPIDRPPAHPNCRCILVLTGDN